MMIYQESRKRNIETIQGPLQTCYIDNMYADMLVEILRQAVQGREDDHGIIMDHTPGSGYGYSFSHDIFALRDWCDCEGARCGYDEKGYPLCPPNFEYYPMNLQGIWYKRAGKSQHFNKNISFIEFLTILYQCLASLGLSPREVELLVKDSHNQK